MSEAALTEWDVKPLSQLAEARRGITYSSAMLKSEEGGLPYINMKSFLKGGGFNVEGTKHYAGNFTQQDVVGERDLLIANTDVTSGDIIGVPALLPEEFAVEQVLYSHHVTRLRINGEVTVPFLYYLLCLPEYRSQMLRIARGTTVLMLDMPAIKRITICAPKNKIDQNRIVEILSTLDKAIEKTEALIAKYQQIKVGLMHDLFTRGVTSDGKLRPPREQAPELYQETPIGWIPKVWEVVHMVDFAEDRKGATTIGPFGSDLVAADYQIEGVPIVFVRDVKESGFEWNSETYVSEIKAQKLNAHSVKAGEILASKMGLPPCVSCLYPEWMPNGIITADMIRLSPDKKKVDGYWLTTAINHDQVKRRVAAITAGVTRPKVTLADFRGIRIAKPKLDEQKVASEILRAAQNNIDAEFTKMDKLHHQKLGLMSDLLTGRVRVND